MKSFKYIALLVVLLLVGGLVGAPGCSPSESTQPDGDLYYPQGDMMGPGGMMGSGGMMGAGGMFGPGGTYSSGGSRITIDQAMEIIENYLLERGDEDLAVEEIMEFSYNFYVELSEKSTGIHAFEALIDPHTGDLYSEPGPNMMWNTKYGVMSGMMWGVPATSDPMSVAEEKATQYAQAFIDDYLPGAEVADADRFYGYYTLHVLNEGQIYGMLSVNGYTGQVWYHSWHGPFLGMKEFDEH
jgi:hypothetical protein